jgi:neutral ceramidase
VDVRWADPQKGYPESARLGTILAGAVMEVFPRLEPIATAPPRVRSEIVELPLPAITPEGIEKARTIVTRVEGARTNAPTFLDRVNAFKTLDVAARDGKPHELEVQVIALGSDVACVSLPGEIFVELGLAIKERSPFRYTFIAELANGSIGYIPNREAYPQGNYEVVSARCAPGGGELLVEAATRLLRELHNSN